MDDLQSSPTATPVKTYAYPCPSCGAQLAYSPEKAGLACSHCGAVVAIAKSTEVIRERDFVTQVEMLGTSRTEEVVKGVTMRCTQCGAESFANNQADHCAFCSSPFVVALSTETARIAPESVLPFAVPKEASSRQMAQWMKARWFAPSGWLSQLRSERIDGVYVPFWTYDSQTTTNYTGARGEHYWETQQYTDAQGKSQTRRVQKTNWYPAAGQVAVQFDDVLICASENLPAVFPEKLEPWNLAELVPYDGQYLAGFIAERYRVELSEGFRRAEQRMDPVIRRAIENDIGGDVQTIHSMEVLHDNICFKHILLPVWVSSFRFHNKTYRITVNGRTGEVVGERPWSWLKIVAVVLFVLALFAVVLIMLQKRS